MKNAPYSSRSYRTLKKSAAALALLAMLAVPGQTFAGGSAADAQYKEVHDLIAEYHINGSKLKDSPSGSIDDLIGSLEDPYTEYFDEKEFAGFQNSLGLKYAGIGMRLGQDETGFVAVQIFEGSPAEAAGLKRGDIIVGVGDKPAAGMTLDELTAQVRGPEGTEVSLKVRRGEDELVIKPVRGEVHLPVVSGGLLEGGYGYVQVASFSEDADELFAAMLAVLEKLSIKGLVVDLRDNPGGLLETAKHIAEQFIPGGVLIHTRDKDDVDEPLAIENGRSVPFPVVVLVNGNSASASEVLTAALQDYHSATAVGEKTYGKGSVQGLYRLQSGGVLKVTIQEYLSPNKRRVNHVGLTPDIASEGYVPQLLTGLRTAGMQQFRLDVRRHSFTLNGHEFFEWSLPVLKKDGSAYMPARVLAALIGEPLEWNEELRGVEIGSSGRIARFDAATGFTIEGGTGFIDLDKFRAVYPQLEVAADLQKTTLTVKGNGK